MIHYLTIKKVSKSNTKNSQIKTAAIKGFSYLMGREVLMKVIAIAGQLILVRLLTPEVFGVFAVISFIFAFCELFTDLGLSMMIIQKKGEPTQSELTTIFYLRIILSLVVIVAILIGSPLIVIAYPYFTPSNIFIVQLLTVIIVLKSGRMVMTSLLERDLRYKLLSGIDLTGMIFYYIVSIVLALMHLGIWSFAWALLVKELIETIIVFANSKWLPKGKFEFSSIAGLLKVGIYYQMSFVSGFIHRATIPLVAGMMSTPYNVGLLDWSSNIASIPRTLSENVGRVSFASFSKIQTKKKLMGIYINKIFLILCLISLYFVAATFSFGKEIVSILLTEKWLPALPALYWFVASTFFLNGTALLGNVILALGKTRIMFLSSLIFISLEYVLSILFLNIFSFTGIAIANFVGIVIMFYYLVFLIHKHSIPTRVHTYIIRASVVLALSLLFNYYFSLLMPQGIIFLIIKSLSFTFIYGGLIKILLPDAIRETLTVLHANKHT